MQSLNKNQIASLKKTRLEKDLEKLRSPLGKRVWFNLRINRSGQMGFGIRKHVAFQKRRNTIDGFEFGEGVVVHTNETAWKIRVVAPQPSDRLGEVVTITIDKLKDQHLLPGITWY